MRDPVYVDVGKIFLSEDRYGYQETVNNQMVVLFGPADYVISIKTAHTNGTPHKDFELVKLFNREQALAELSWLGKLDPSKELDIMGAATSTFTDDMIIFVKDLDVGDSATIFVHGRLEFGE